MKEVIYFLKGDDKTFLLTDNEFIEAKSIWDIKNSYWCHRLEKLMPPSYKMVGTPDEDMGFKEIFIDVRNNRKIYFRGKEYYTKIFENGIGRLVNISEKFLDKKTLINQEEFFSEKKYLE